MCEHHKFNASVKVVRIEDTGQFMAEITIECAQCKIPMQFLGLEPGMDMGGARISVDGLEARIAIVPQGTKPDPFHRIAFNINKFDS